MLILTTGVKLLSEKAPSRKRRGGSRTRRGKRVPLGVINREIQQSYYKKLHIRGAGNGKRIC
ncbi:hypothetical protein CUU66_16880 [Peribacillus deserti]|uniref:Uncharacterized protein n=1 Tax=Peribacillus deserti TaxID=673318 RepID=A0A2N5M321_9BACI|nr:hypothetical protein CUU66_16880 [Peribacillus deserti]